MIDEAEESALPGRIIMSISTLTDTDLQVRDAVRQRLEWDGQVDASLIGVSAKDGVVTLTGLVDTYAGKLAAERIAKRIRRVRAVANDIQVRLRMERTDTDIAHDALRALEMRGTADTVQLVVHGGHVTLTGTVRTLFHRAVAAKALRHIKGIKGIVNRIQVVPLAPVRDIQSHISRTLHHDADVSARGIEAVVSGDTVTLTGCVRSWRERESAEVAAMHAPGIAHIDNRIVVEWPDHPTDVEIC
jgi:osmotically-inducible protein OsmY